MSFFIYVLTTKQSQKYLKAINHFGFKIYKKKRFKKIFGIFSLNFCTFHNNKLPIYFQQLDEEQ